MTPLRDMQTQMPMPCEDSVYSYLMCIPPIEQRRKYRYVTNLIIFAIVLVLVNFVMQVGLLYVVGQHIMKKHTEWISNIANLKHHAWYHVFPMPYNRPPPKCKGRHSPLCHSIGDDMSCSPLSVNVLADWELLDIDGDGVWAREEAENQELRELVECEYNVDLPSLFKSTVKNLNNSHALTGRINSNLFAGNSVHKAYMNWYLHKPLLCQYGDQDMCGALFQRGFFDEALKQQPLSEFKDTESALKYCHDILQYECFDILPNTYKVWRFTANQQCGAKIFGQALYDSPTETNPDGLYPMLTVDFRKRVEYSSTKTLAFRLFLCILLVTFLSVMSEEMRKITKTFIWCALFPADKEKRDPGHIVGRSAVRIGKGATDTRQFVEDDEPHMEIRAVRLDHRILVIAITLLRLLLWCFLLWSGVMFLTGPPRYLTLIFDALSLVFIFEIDELLYRTMLRHEFKEDHLAIKTMTVAQWHGGYLPMWSSVAGDIVRFLFVIAFAVVIVITYCKFELNPLLSSLECLCSVQGSQCLDATRYSKMWWDRYWSTTLPASGIIINQLKAL